MNPATHPNGFVIRLLHTFHSGARLRLHTWPAGKARLDSPHDHRSWFLSLPLWGRFIERRFIEHEHKDGTAPFDVLRCYSTSGNGKPVTTPEGKSALLLTSARTRRPLVPYFCPTQAIHSFVPVSPGFAASLVLFGPPKQVPRAFIRSES